MQQLSINNKYYENKNLFNIAIISLLAILFHACSKETVSSSVDMTIPTGDLVLMPVVDWKASSKGVKMRPAKFSCIAQRKAMLAF